MEKWTIKISGENDTRTYVSSVTVSRGKIEQVQNFLSKIGVDTMGVYGDKYVDDVPYGYKKVPSYQGTFDIVPE